MATPPSRSRLACFACTRRKVKCSKTVPCTNCARRGEEASCVVEARQGPSQSPARIALTRDQEIDSLRRQLTKLRNQSHIGSHVNGTQPPCQVEDQASSGHHTAIEEHDVAVGLTTQQPISGPTDSGDASVAQDAASILEFLAWGRQKDPSLPAVVSPKVERNSHLDFVTESFDDFSSLAVLQSMLPNSSQVRQLVDYHCYSLLWYHGSFYTPAFLEQLNVFFVQHRGQLASPGINLQWVALLFSILTGSLTCVPPPQAQAWGYGDAERATLSKRWFQAITTCLNRADHTSNLSTFACQAIATGTISAHLLGFSSSQSIHLAATVRIAQSLGLHRLDSETVGSTTHKHIGRRVWTQLSTQDWFSIPFSESYIVNPLYSHSAPPSNCHDHDLMPVSAQIPTITSYCRFLHKIASLMPQLQDGLMACNTAYTRYEQVLKWDARLRTLAINERPKFLSSIPLEPSWPVWVPWARRALAISSSHKIIMIHRSFLSDSFTNPAFGFTRRTCLAASKTIVKEFKLVIEEDGPILWIHQAFAVAAGIILSLDVLHRERQSTQCAQQRELVEAVISILHSCSNSTIAMRGIKLLEALKVEISKTALSPHGTKRRRDGISVNTFNLPGFVKSFHANEARQDHDSDTLAPQCRPPSYGMENVIEIEDESQFSVNFAFLPMGFNDTNGFENLLYLANHDIPTSW